MSGQSWNWREIKRRRNMCLAPLTPFAAEHPGSDHSDPPATLSSDSSNSSVSHWNVLLLSVMVGLLWFLTADRKVLRGGVSLPISVAEIESKTMVRLTIFFTLAGPFLLHSLAGAQLAELAAELNEGVSSQVPWQRSSDLVGGEGEAYFLAEDHSRRKTLWRTRGTSASTWPVYSGAAQLLGTDYDGAFFLAAEGLLWSNGKRPSTAEAVVLAPSGGDLFGQAGFQLDSERVFVFGLESLAVVSRTSYELVGPARSTFAVAVKQGEGILYTGPGGSLWFSDGTAAGTFEVDVPPEQQRFIGFSGRHAYWFQSSGGTGQELWSFSLDHLRAAKVETPSGSSPSGLRTGAGERAYFRLGEDQSELWSALGAQPRKELTYGADGIGFEAPLFEALAVETARGLLLFGADDAGAGYLLLREWGSSTIRTLAKVCSICRPDYRWLEHRDASGNVLLFFGTTLEGTRVWFSDSTVAGSRPLGGCFHASRGCTRTIDGVGQVLPDDSDRENLVAVDMVSGQATLLGPMPPISKPQLARIGTLLIAVDPVGNAPPHVVDFEQHTLGPLLEEQFGAGSDHVLVPGFGSPLTAYLQVSGPPYLAIDGVPASVEPLPGVDYLGGHQLGNRLLRIRRQSGNLALYSLDLTNLHERAVTEEFSYMVSTVGDRLVYSTGVDFWSTDGIEPAPQFLFDGEVAGRASFTAARFAVVVESGEQLQLVLSDGTSQGTRTLDLQEHEQCRRTVAGFTAESIYFVSSFGTGNLCRASLGLSMVAPEPIEVPGSDFSGVLTAEDFALIFFRDEQQGYRYLLEDGDTELRFQGTTSLDVSLRIADHTAVVLGDKIVVAKPRMVLELTRDGASVEHPVETTGELISYRDERAFLVAAGENKGFELRSIERGAFGLRLVHDIWPGPLSSEPQQLRLADDLLYFTADDGLVGREIWAVNLNAEGCKSSEHTMCLLDDRLQANVHWRTADQDGRAVTLPITADSGAFWFFSPANLEVLLKVVDGLTVNERFWMFFGSLSNVQYDITISDQTTGISNRRRNPQGVFASGADIEFLPNKADAELSTPDWLSATDHSTTPTSFDGVSGPCRGGSEYLCLQDFYELSLSWQATDGSSGPGFARSLTSDTGAFWFFAPENLELLVKVLDASAINGHIWVFFGAASNLGLELTVRETTTGETRIYTNSLGNFVAVGDTTAFAKEP